MSVSVELLDHIVSILETELNSGSAFTITRKILPRSKKQTRSKPEIFVSLNSMTSVESSRGSYLMEYQVGVALAQDAVSETNTETAMSNIENIVSTLESNDYKSFTTSENSLKFCYKPPFTLDPVFDPTILNEQSTFVSVALFNYVYIKERV